MRSVESLVTLTPNNQKKKTYKGREKELRVANDPLENGAQTEKKLHYLLFLHVLPPNINYCCFKRVKNLFFTEYTKINSKWKHRPKYNG